jgi:hypothetical protein
MKGMEGSSLSWWDSGAVLWGLFTVGLAVDALITGGYKKWLIGGLTLLLSVGFVLGGMQVRRRLRRSGYGDRT